MRWDMMKSFYFLNTTKISFVLQYSLGESSIISTNHSATSNIVMWRLLSSTRPPHLVLSYSTLLEGLFQTPLYRVFQAFGMTFKIPNKFSSTLFFKQ